VQPTNDIAGSRHPRIEKTPADPFENLRNALSLEKREEKHI
jgi:hypothetical protein